MSAAGTAIALALVLTAQQAQAVTHTEIGDAPSLPPGQTPTGSGALTSISGATSAGDQEDAYQICVTGDSFSATTVGGASFDTQLFLFNDDGTGVARGTVANDDTSPGFQSTLPPGGTALTNGGTLHYLPGVYYLAISGYDDDPVDANGTLIFPSTPFTGVFGPNAGVGPWAGWTGAGDVGSYTITLTGAATFASAPCASQGGVCAGPPPPGAIVGTAGNNVITPTFNSTGGPLATPGPDVIFGLDGNDILNGGDGDDIICGGGGNDVVQGGSGNDFVVGGGGNDLVQGGSGEDSGGGGDGNDVVQGGDGNDVVSGGNGNDNVDGNAGINRTSGDAGTDNCDNPDPPSPGDFGCEV